LNPSEARSADIPVRSSLGTTEGREALETHRKFEHCCGLKVRTPAWDALHF
jgi:hypothetical protein